MKFWDTSALVPLMVQEPATTAREHLLRSDLTILVWWATAVECASALRRLVREGALRAADAEAAEARLRQFEQFWVAVEPADPVRRQAARLLRIHPLRAADALQLAAALVACQHDPRTLPFVCADDRLATAARLEGFDVLT
ncbi:MAG: type II toxin-antitoxin system VapC family toxin [Verrucomicrobiae bacterium]|nr:type II toxin-antitoxin system VapC family toxin [Verrucomicrobiae bacterium]